MFNARDAKSWQRLFPVGFSVKVCALNLLFINILHDVVARIESRCVIEAKHVLLVWSCWSVNSFDFRWKKTALALKRLCNFSRDKSNQLTDQQDMFCYITRIWRDPICCEALVRQKSLSDSLRCFILWLIFLSICMCSKHVTKYFPLTTVFW